MERTWKSKEELSEQTLAELKEETAKDAWIELKQYFDGRGNAPAAKIACIVIGALAREEQAKNNSRQLDILEKRLNPKQLNA